MAIRIGVLLGLIVAGIPATTFSTQRAVDTKVLHATEQAIQIEFTPAYNPAKTIKFGDQTFVEYDFDGSIPSADHRQAGVPDLRHKNICLGFQSKEGNVVHIIAADYEDIPDVMLKPVPSLKVEDQIVTVNELAIDAERYGQNRFLPGTVAELSPVEQVRSMLIGGVKLSPLQYNPSKKVLRKYSRIVVEIVYGASSLARIRTNDEELFEGAMLNFDQAKNWKFGSARLSSPAGAPSVLSQGNWYRLTVAEEGMYKLDAGWFTANGITLTGVNPQTIEIYGNGGEELPENVSAARPVDLVENAIHVEGEADGRWDAADYLLFFGKGVQGIRYHPATKTLRHYIHHYGRVNYYWLRFGVRNGKRMAQQPSVGGTATVIPTKFLDAVFVEPDTFNFLKSGKHWFSLPVTNGGVIARSFQLNGLIPSEPRIYRYSLVASSSSLSRFFVRETSMPIDSPYVGPSTGSNVAESAYSERVGTYPLSNNASQLTFTFSGNASASGYLDWIEIVYQRSFEPVNNYLRFRSPDTTAIVQYQLGQFSSTPTVFNVTDHANVKRVAIAAGSFKAAETSGQTTEYVSTSAYKTPIAVTSVPNQNLRGITQQVDFIILTSPEFQTAANQLKSHREKPAYGNLRTLVVDVNHVYNEFSGGIPDITAIRDFLKYAYENYGTSESRPRFALFLGQGSYDYKGITGKSSYVPTWETENSFDDIFSSATDDFFVRFGEGADGSRPWIVTGRLNARSTSEANFLVERLIAYDTRSSQDQWKMRAVFVADDGDPDGVLHTDQSERLASQYTPDIFEKVKIYVEEYPTVQTSQGRRKPNAYQDIIDNINRGALLVNFTGHGNPTVWTHESVFSVPTSIPQLVNADKLAFFFGATCNFSQFDDPTRQTGSEQLMNRVGGGAIGVVSASRKVYAHENSALNIGIYQSMFRVDARGRMTIDRVATALFQYKQFVNSDNDEKYLVLGDPTMRLQFPRGSVVVDHINELPVDSVNGVPRTTPIQLKALSRVNVKGSIRNEAGAVDTTVNGRAIVVVNDATRTIPIPTFGNFTYKAVGGLVYKGQNSVSRGRFNASFIVPKDIAYADSTTRGRLVVYLSSDTSSAAGYTSKIWVGGSDQTASNDTVGPSIRILLGNTYEQSLAFRQGDIVNERPILFVDLVDSTGINTSTSGVGHRIEAWINDEAQSRDMSDFYTTKLDNFQEGTVTYPLRDLPKGRNSIRVRAWDTYNNARTAQTFFEVMSSDQLRVVDVMNYPNPFVKTTAFTFRHNQPVPVSATVKVYTLAGRLIQTVDRPFATESFVSIPWDGRDKEGDIIANGVYLYKLLVRTLDGRFNSEVLGKLAVAK